MNNLKNRKKSVKLITVTFIILVTLLLMELAGQLAYKFTHNGMWLLFIDYSSKEIFNEHPYLVVTPKSGTVITKDNIVISHNKLGFRGREISLIKENNDKRVVVLGGSSTYCVGVSDNETWPFYLENDLSNHWEVINLGVPGYSTVENLIQTAFILPELSPDIAIYYEGWNDLRNVHIKNLKSDYSDFHGKSQYYSLGLQNLKIGQKSVIVRSLYYLFSKLFTENTKEDYLNVKHTNKAFTREIDQYAIYLYRRNLESIIALCKRFNIKLVMVPQIYNSNKLVSDKPYGWIPFLNDKDVVPMVSLYNKTMRDVALSEKVGFIEISIESNFMSSDFIDQVHFSSAGNKKFAKIVADYIRTKVP